MTNNYRKIQTFWDSFAIAKTGTLCWLKEYQGRIINVSCLKDLFQAEDDWDTEYLRITHRDEFMSIDDYVLMNREEAIDHLLNGGSLQNNIWDN